MSHVAVDFCLFFCAVHSKGSALLIQNSSFVQIKLYSVGCVILFQRVVFHHKTFQFISGFRLL